MLHAANNTGSQRIRQIAAFFALAVLLPAALAARIDPKLESVSVYLNVEKNGNLVSGLSQGNFRLYEDGNAVPFRLEKPEEPASIALLVEYSRSSGYSLDDINASIQGLVKYAPEGHWYALATYSHELEIHTDLTEQVGLLAGAYSELGIPIWNEIDSYDAVYEMLDKMGRLPGRRILIVVGSGLDTFSEHTLDDVKKKLESHNVTIFVAGVGSSFRGTYSAYLDSASRTKPVLAQAFLQMLADKSGGFAWFPNFSTAFPSVLEGILQSIATQYRLVYDTTGRGSGKFHKIKVEAFRIVDDKQEDFEVLVREGWR